MNAYKLSEEEDPQLQDSLTPGASQQQQAPVIPPPPSQPSAPPPAMTAAKPPVMAPPPAAAPTIPGMPPSVSADDISTYLNQQKGSVDKYGAQAQMNLQNQLNQRRNSLGYKITDAGKGFADALMMGVARAGNPGFQNQFEGQENQFASDQMGNLRGANEAQIKGTEAKMTLDKMNPNSVLSKSAQDSYGPLFQKLGYPPNKIKSMSAANIDAALNLMTQYGGKEVEAQIKQYELEAERMRIMASIANQQEQTRLADKKSKQDALQDLSKMPWYSRILHPGVSSALEENAGLDQPAAGGAHPDAGAALKWAQENPTDPRATKILERLKQ